MNRLNTILTSSLLALAFTSTITFANVGINYYGEHRYFQPYHEIQNVQSQTNLNNAQAEAIRTYGNTNYNYNYNYNVDQNSNQNGQYNYNNYNQ